MYTVLWLYIYFPSNNKLHSLAFTSIKQYYYLMTRLIKSHLFFKLNTQLKYQNWNQNQTHRNFNDLVNIIWTIANNDIKRENFIKSTKLFSRYNIIIYKTFQ